MDSEILEIIVAVAIGLYVSSKAIENKFLQVRSELAQLKSNLDRRCDELESFSMRNEANFLGDNRDKKISISIYHHNETQSEPDPNSDNL
jgi:hypothetical protein